MKAITLGKYKTLKDIEAPSRNYTNRIGELRNSTRILIIDNDDLELIETLRANSYNIKFMRDIAAIEIARDYKIVMCDIYDVGINLNPSLHGAHVIREMKKAYPYKPVVAYSSGVQQNREMYATAIREADNFIQKDAPVEDWMNILDQLVLDVSDPIRIWTRTRTYLLEAGMSPLELARAEDKFVREVERDPSKAASVIGLLGKSIKADELIIKILVEIGISLVAGAVSAT